MKHKDIAKKIRNRHRIEDIFGKYRKTAVLKTLGGGLDILLLSLDNIGNDVIEVSETVAQRLIEDREELFDVILELSDALEKHDPEARDEIIQKDRT